MGKAQKIYSHAYIYIYRFIHGGTQLGGMAVKVFWDIGSEDL